MARLVIGLADELQRKALLVKLKDDAGEARCCHRSADGLDWQALPCTHAGILSSGLTVPRAPRLVTCV